MKYVIKCTDCNKYAKVSFCTMVAIKVDLKEASRWPEKGMAETIALELCDVEVVEVK